MVFRYRLSPIGRFFIIYIICIIFYYFLESYIEEKYLKKIDENCTKNGYHEDYKIYINCKNTIKDF